MERLTDIERQRIRIALIEDGTRDDVTSMATVPEEVEGVGSLLAKSDGIVAGLDVFRYSFLLYEVLQGISSTIFEFKEQIHDGSPIRTGETVATIRAQLRTLLAAERVALNFLQRMSGIATLSNQFVKAVEGTGAVILDTRKTAPLLRPFDRYAVRAGGATNHRYSLADMILVKDNHIAVNNGDIQKVIASIREFFSRPDQKRMPVEIEVTSLEQLEDVLRYGTGIVTRVLLDNFELTLLREAVALNHGIYETEASGGITLDNVRPVAESGVNFISVGALTHSVRALDISFEITPL